MTAGTAQAARLLAEMGRKALPPVIRKKSGRILYTPVSTLKPHPVYFLGINPAEDSASTTAEAHSRLTIDTDIDRLERGEVHEHAYLDEVWSGNAPGCAKMQLNARALFEILHPGRGDEFLRATPASNVVFVRSRDERALRSEAQIDTASLVRMCWAVHAEVLRIVRPEVVIVHGAGVSQKLRGALRLRTEARRAAGHGDWGLHAYQVEGGPVLAAIPNLSRYTPDGDTGQPRALRSFFEEFVPDVLE